MIDMKGTNIKRFKFVKYFLTKSVLEKVVLIVIVGLVGILLWFQNYQILRKQRLNADIQIRSLNEQVDSLLQEKLNLQVENERLVEAYSLVATDSAVLKNESWESALVLYSGIKEKYDDYVKRGVDLEDYESDLSDVLDFLLNGDYEKLSQKVNELDSDFEKLLAIKVAEDKKKVEEMAKKKAAFVAVSAPVTNRPGAGYSRITVATEKGNFVTNLIMVDLGQVQVVTLTGNDGNCENNCVTKSLGTYVSENSGFAGINGTYFCPPDYGSCVGKVNSYDFPVYSSVYGKWINADKLFWNNRAMIGFSGSSARFCADAKICDPGVSAGIVNYPSLIDNGNIVVNPNSLSDSLKSVRGYRGAIGVSGNWLYLMVVRGATVPDVAYVMKALNISSGMNLDGGGSTALYYYGYKVGPGRSLPNAIVLKYR